MLNDSKEIAATLYLTSAILAVVIVISIALSTRLNVYTASYCYGIPLSTGVVLIVVFFTKVKAFDNIINSIIHCMFSLIIVYNYSAVLRIQCMQYGIKVHVVALRHFTNVFILRQK